MPHARPDNASSSSPRTSSAATESTFAISRRVPSYGNPGCPCTSAPASCDSSARALAISPSLCRTSDEGFVQPAIVQEAAAAPGTANPMYVYESFCHWQGWSLSAPPPANPIGSVRRRPPSRACSRLPQCGGDGSGGPARLPRLRYGTSYQLRVRTVDLAGNSLSVEEPTNCSTSYAIHGRPEPFHTDHSPPTSLIAVTSQCRLLCWCRARS